MKLFLLLLLIGITTINATPNCEYGQNEPNCCYGNVINGTCVCWGEQIFGEQCNYICRNDLCNNKGICSWDGSSNPIVINDTLGTVFGTCQCDNPLVTFKDCQNPDPIDDDSNTGSNNSSDTGSNNSSDTGSNNSSDTGSNDGSNEDSGNGNPNNLNGGSDNYGNSSGINNNINNGNNTTVPYVRRKISDDWVIFILSVLVFLLLICILLYKWKCLRKCNRTRSSQQSAREINVRV